MTTYHGRLMDPVMAELLSELPAVMITGPRACGKTTSARRLARSVLALDEQSVRRAVRLDPDSVLASFPEPILVDEWQLEPSVLGAIKRAIDRESRAGRFLITGSAATDSASDLWPATGRIVRTRLRTFTQAEVHDVRCAPFVERIIELARDSHGQPASEHTILDYLTMAARGGFPQLIAGTGTRSSEAWLSSYIEHACTHDMTLPGGRRDPARIRRAFDAMAANTAGTPTETTLLQAAGVTRATWQNYEAGFAALGLTELIPAWHSNQVTRLTKTPKRYLADIALAFAALRLSPTGLLLSPDMLGRVVDNFVYQQLATEVDITSPQARLFHLRQQDGMREIDLLIELGNGELIAVEVKAGNSPDRADARHLEWLRDRFPDRFLAGVVLHTGSLTVRPADRIVFTPISTLWTSA